jgi:hypothetical protein
VRGKEHEREGTVFGWQLSLRTEARTSRPPAATVVKDQEQGVLWRRTLCRPTPTKVAGAARRRQPDCEKHGGDGVDRCWLDPQGITGVLPAHAERAVTADGRAQATAAEGMTIGGWVREVDNAAYRSFPKGSPQCTFATGISTS